VIGAGVIGAAVAFELARSGRRVVVVDKGPAAGSGSTSSSSAVIRFSSSTPAGVLTAWESAAMWEDWAGHLGVVDPDGLARYVRTGNLIFATPDWDADHVAGLWADIGIPHERLDGAAIGRRFPALELGSFHPPKRIDDPAFAADPGPALSAIWSGDGGYIDDPMLAAHNLAHAAAHHGAMFRYRTEVAAVERTGHRVTGVRLTDGTVIEAPVVVNVAGPWSSRVNELAGVAGEVRIRHRPLRQEVYVVPGPAGFRLGEGATLVADLDLGQYVRPQVGGTLLVGGTEPACDPLEWVDDPDDYVDRPTRERWETAMLRLARRLPDFGLPPHPVGLAALYDASDDWMPIYDRSSLGGFFMACGTSGNQFKNAPMVGRFLRALVDAADAGVDHDVTPVHVTGARTGRSIDLAAFSRLRSPAATSGTVMG
jgi:sarcosine oxidase subunit beta